MPKPKYLLNVDGKEYPVSVENIEKYTMQKYASDYPDATIRMRNDNDEDYDIPLSRYEWATSRGLRPFSMDVYDEGEEQADYTKPGVAQPDSIVGGVSRQATAEKPANVNSYRQSYEAAQQSAQPQQPQQPAYDWASGMRETWEPTKQPVEAKRDDTQGAPSNQQPAPDWGSALPKWEPKSPAKRTEATNEEDAAIDSTFEAKPVERAEDIYRNYQERFALTEEGQQLAAERQKVESDTIRKFWDEFTTTPEYQAIAGQKYKDQAEIDAASQQLNELFEQRYGQAVELAMKPYYEQVNEAITARYGDRIDAEFEQLNSKVTTRLEDLYQKRIAPLFEKYRQDADAAARKAIMDDARSINRILPGGSGTTLPGMSGIASEKVKQETDPAKVMNEAAAMLTEMSQQDPELREEIAGIAKLLGKDDVDAFTEEVVQYARQRMTDDYIQQNTPKNSFEYLMKAGFGSSMLGMVGDLANKSLTQRQIEQAGLQGYKPSDGEEIGAMFLGIAADLPMLAASGGVGGAVGKQLIKQQAAKLIASGISREVAEGIAMRAIQQTGMRWGLRAASEAATFAALEGAGSAIQQAYANGEIDPFEVMSSMGRGAGTGAVMGVFGVGNEIFKGGAKRMLGDTAGKALGYTTSLGGRTSILAGSSVMGQYMSDPAFDINNVDWTKEFTHAALMNVGFDVLGAVKRYAARKPGMKDIDLESFKLTKDNIEQLNAAGIEGSNAMEIAKSLLQLKDAELLRQSPEAEAGLAGKEWAFVEQSLGVSKEGSALGRLLTDPNVDMATKAKIGYLMTGRAFEVMPSTRVSMEQDEAGNYIVTSFDPSGQTNETRRFANEAEARNYFTNAESDAKRNQVSALEGMMDDAGKMASATELFDIVAKQFGVTREQIAQVYADGRNGVKLQGRERQAYERLDDMLKGMIRYENYHYSTNELKRRMNEGYGEQEGWIDAVLKKSYKRLNDRERQAYNEYIDNMIRLLEGEQTASNRLLGVEAPFDGAAPSGPVAGLPGAPVTEVSAPAATPREMRMQQAAELFGRGDKGEIRGVGILHELAEERLAEVGVDEATRYALANGSDAERQQIIDGLSGEQQRRAIDYVEKVDMYAGVNDAIDAKHEAAYDAALSKIETMTGPNGKVNVVHLGDKADDTHRFGVVVNGLDANNQVTNSSKQVLVVPIETVDNRLNYSSFDENNVVSVRLDSVDDIGQYSTDYIEDVILPEYVQDIHTLDGRLPYIGEEVTIADADGNEGVVVVVDSHVLEGGDVEYIVMDKTTGTQDIISMDELRQMQQAAEQLPYRRAYQAEDARIQAEAAAAEKARIRAEQAAERARIKAEAEAAAAAERARQEAEARKPINRLKKYPEGHEKAGKPDYESSKPEDVRDYLVESLGVEDALKSVKAQSLKLVQDAESITNKLEEARQKLSAGGFMPDEAIEARQQIAEMESELAAIEKRQSFWDGVDVLIGGPKQEKADAIIAASEARQRRKRAERKPSERYNKLLEELSDSEAAFSILQNLEPQTPEELAAEMLADGIRLMKQDETVGGAVLKGFLSHTGYSHADTKRYPFIFASRDKGGVSMEEFGEMLEEASEELGIRFDGKTTQEGLTALLRVLGSIEKQGDFARYIEKRRMAEAEEVYRREQAEYERERDAAYEREYGLNYDEYEAAISELTGEYIKERDLFINSEEYQDFIATFGNENLPKPSNNDTRREAGQEPASNGNGEAEGSPDVAGGNGGDIQGAQRSGVRPGSVIAEGSNEGGRQPRRGDEAGSSVEGGVQGSVPAGSGEVTPIGVGDEKKNSAFDNTTDTGETSERGKRNDTATSQNTVSTDKGSDISVTDKKTGEKVFDVVEYSDKSIAVVGDTKAIKDELKKLGGRFNGRLNVGGKKVAGWIFPKGKRAEVEKLTGEVKPNSLAAAEAEVNTEPSEAQKKAGNYKMGHVKLFGFDVTIENPKGSERKGVDASGKPWSVTMNNTYGYIRGTEGVDGDHIDVFLSNHPDNWNEKVFVVDQVNSDGSFDEHKVMIGFNSLDEARENYYKNYSEDWDGLGAITEVSLQDFKKWIDSSHRKTKAFSEYKIAKSSEFEKISKQIDESVDKLKQSLEPREYDERGRETAASQAGHSRGQADITASETDAIPEGSRLGERGTGRSEADGGTGTSVEGTRGRREKLTEYNGYKVGERILYKGQPAKIYEFEADGTPVLDTGMAPVIYEIGYWDNIEKAPAVTVESVLEGVKGRTPEAKLQKVEAATGKQGKEAIEAVKRETKKPRAKKQESIGSLFAEIDKQESALDAQERAIDEALALMPGYEASASTPANELPHKPSEKVLNKAAIKFAKAFASHIGGVLDTGKGKMQLANIAPIGGNVTFRVWLDDAHQHGVYMNIDVESAPGKKSEHAELILGDGYWRLTTASDPYGTRSRNNHFSLSDKAALKSGKAMSEVADNVLLALDREIKKENKVELKPENNDRGTISSETERVGEKSNDVGVRPDGSGHRDTSPSVELGREARETAERDGGRGTRGGSDGSTEPDTQRSSAVSGRDRQENVLGDGIIRNQRNYSFGEEHLELPKGEIGKLKGNIDAIRILKELEASGREATQAEKEALKLFVGWGGLADALNTTEYNRWKAMQKYGSTTNWGDKWGKHYETLRPLMTDEEWADAQRSTLSSHYTPESVIRALWNGVEYFGFTGGAVSEPGLGVGHILGFMPKNLSERSIISGFEIDSLPGRIAQQLYPDANIRVAGFETAYTPNSKDAVVTNVPFGKVAPVDPMLDKTLRRKIGGAYNLHNYFIVKILLELKPGGIGAFITSSATLDSHNSKAREYMASIGADLLGAIRLPNHTFKSNAGTEVTADILFFRKRLPGEAPNGISYVGTTQIGEGTNEEYRDVPGYYGRVKESVSVPIIVNEYFAAHPEMMLGEMMTAHDAGTGGLYGGDSLTLVGDKNADLFVQIDDALSKMEQPKPQAVEATASTGKQPRNRKSSSGKLTVKEGKVYVSNEDGTRDEVAAGTFKHNKQTRNYADAAADYIALKETLQELIEAERTQVEDPAELRAKLNQQYDEFVSKYGTLNENRNLNPVLEEDFERFLPQSLEKVTKGVDPATGKRKTTVEKADGILTHRVSQPMIEPTTANSIEDAIGISMAYHGFMDLRYIAQLTGMSRREVAEEVVSSGNAFDDPETGDVIDKDTYLSGNVVEKLIQAREAAAVDPKFERNVSALEAVQPEVIPFVDISYKMGTPWIPAEVYESFALEVMGLGDVRVKYLPAADEFVVQDGWPRDYGKSNEYSTTARKAMDLFKDAINLRKPTIYEKDADGNRRKNETATQEAIAKVMDINDAFKQYIEERSDLHRELQNIYNDRYNNYRLREYSEPSFAKDEKGDIHYPNSNTAITLRDHQVKAVQRSLGESTLLAHQVGTGKTFTMITTAMEMRRLGIAKKPLIVVQNATLNDFAADFLKLYPGAKILVPSEKERSASQRKRLFNMIATGDFDAIIIPQSFLAFIPDDPARKRALIQQRVDEIMQASEELALTDKRAADRLRKEADLILKSIDEEGVVAPKGKKANVKKEAEKQEKALSRETRKLERRTDDVLTFEQMGIDALFIDEAHNYKKIGFSTKMQNVKGVDSGYSERANSLLLKASYVQERNGGRNVILATGTPITNTMAEVWTMMRFVAPDILESYHIKTFDEFAATFGSVEPSLEFTSTGSFKIADRFKSYVNVPELIKAFRSHADVVLTEDVKEFEKSKSIPKMKDGQMTNHVIAKSDELQDVMNILIDALKEDEKKSGNDRTPGLPLVVFSKAKQAAIDLRLLNPLFPDDPNSKTNLVVAEAFRIYKESTPEKGVQMIFCDSYQSPGSKPNIDLFEYDESVPRFNLYQDIKQKLIDRGIPKEQIVIVSDLNNAERKKAVFEKARNGEVRILIGSTEKMGVGVNVQDRMIALHHMDAPIRPMDFEQRNGRILRQGNMYAQLDKPVEVVTYGVEGTLDATAYDRLRIKQNFINQMMKGDISGRVMEETDDDDPSGKTFNQMAAELSGDKTAQLLFVAEANMKKLAGLERSHRLKIDNARMSIDYEKELLRVRRDDLKVLESKLAAVNAQLPDGVKKITANGVTFDDKLQKGLTEVVEAYEEQYALNRGVAPLRVKLNGGVGEVVYYHNEGKLSYNLHVGGQDIGSKELNVPGGAWMSLNNTLAALPTHIEKKRKAIAEGENKIKGYQSMLDKPFPKIDELNAARQEVKELRAELEAKAKAESGGGDDEIKMANRGRGDIMDRHNLIERLKNFGKKALSLPMSERVAGDSIENLDALDTELTSMKQVAVNAPEMIVAETTTDLLRALPDMAPDKFAKVVVQARRSDAQAMYIPWVRKVVLLANKGTVKELRDASWHESFHFGMDMVMPSGIEKHFIVERAAAAAKKLDPVLAEWVESNYDKLVQAEELVVHLMESVASWMGDHGKIEKIRAGLDWGDKYLNDVSNRIINYLTNNDNGKDEGNRRNAERDARAYSEENSGWNDEEEFSAIQGRSQDEVALREAEYSVNQFVSKAKNHAAFMITNSVDDLYSLRDYNVPEEKIQRYIKDATDFPTIRAIYNEDADIVILFANRFEHPDDVELVLWHEQAHYIEYHLDMPNKLKLLNSCLQYLKEKYPATYENIVSFFKDEAHPYEAIGELFEQMAFDYGTDRLLNSEFNGNSDVATLVSEIIKHTKDGKEKSERDRLRQSRYDAREGEKISRLYGTDEGDTFVRPILARGGTRNNGGQELSGIPGAEPEEIAGAADGGVMFKLRTDPAPRKTGIGYKVFVLKDGKLYPPMVANPGGEDTPVAVWLDADAAPIAEQSKTGRNKVKAGGKGTQGGSGTLAYRPGWHLGEIPYALQFNRLNPETGERELFPANFVWAEVEYANDVDYQDEAMSYGMKPSGKFQHSLAGLPRLPENGSYKYRTNPNPETDPWVITGAMRVKRLLPPSEVDAMVELAGRAPQQRQAGAVTDAEINALNEQLFGDEAIKLKLRGKPRRKDGESLISYNKRLKQWQAEKEAAMRDRSIEDNGDLEDPISKELGDLAEEMMAHPQPKWNPGESKEDYLRRFDEWSQWIDTRGNEVADRMNELRKQAEAEKASARSREMDTADLRLSPAEEIGRPIDDEGVLTEDEMREVRAIFHEKLGDMKISRSKEQLKADIRQEIIERRRYIDSANLEDAFFIDKLTKKAAKKANEVLAAIPDYIEGTYEGEVTPELVETAKMVSDWFEEVYNLMAREGVLYDAPKIQNYVTHIWDWKRSPLDAQEKYTNFVNTMRMRSPYTRHRVIPSYAEGKKMGMVPKYPDIRGIITEYGHYATETIANHRIVEFLKNFKYFVPAGDGEMPHSMDLIIPESVKDADYSRMNHTALDGYKVLNRVKPMITPVFGDQRIIDPSHLNVLTNKLIDGIWLTSGAMKKIALSFSFFHHGALTETAVSMLKPWTAGKVIAKNLIWDVITKGNIPAMNDKEAARDAVKHLVSLGASNDYAVADVANLTTQLYRWTKDNNVYVAREAAAVLDFLNKGQDKILWDVIHDGFKIASFAKLAKEIREKARISGWDEATTERALDEAGQLVNDTYGGLHFDILGYSPKSVRIMRALLLSPDWTLATIRQALSPFGFGTLYKSDTYWKSLSGQERKEAKAMAEAPAAMRKKYGRQFWITAGIFFYGLMNGLNAYFRIKDEDEARKEADEMRKVDPDYKSAYELAYPDGMKWYDYTMAGNSLGHQTHLFTGHYEDGTETYVRWGKQFRELPELFFGRDGFSIPGPIIDKMAGKANPLLSTTFEFISGYSLSGWEVEAMKDKKGWERDVARLYLLATKFVPYSVPTQEDKEFMAIDLMMPSSKGMTPGKAINYFEKAIKAGDSDFVGQVYQACVMNGLEAEKYFDVAKARIEAEVKQNMLEGVESVEDALKAYDATDDARERARYLKYIEQQMGAQDFEQIERDELIEQAQEVMTGTRPTKVENQRYVEFSNSDDVLQDYRLKKTISGLKKYYTDYTELASSDVEAAKRMLREKRMYIEGYQLATKYRTAITKLKKRMGHGEDPEIMKEIRRVRQECFDRLGALAE